MSRLDAVVTELRAIYWSAALQWWLRASRGEGLRPTNFQMSSLEWFAHGGES